jgi:hypothetical protein
MGTVTDSTLGGNCECRKTGEEVWRYSRSGLVLFRVCLQQVAVSSNDWIIINNEMGVRCNKPAVAYFKVFFVYLLTVHLSIILDNDQLDTHLLYFTIRLL